MATHAIKHIEIASPDPKRAVEFYSKVFGYEFGYMAEHDYHGAMGEGGAGMGIMQATDENPAGVVPYVIADDPKSFLDKAVAEGGQKIMDLMEIPNVGHMVVFTDPDGNPLGVIVFDLMQHDPTAGD